MSDKLKNNNYEYFEEFILLLQVCIYKLNLKLKYQRIPKEFIRFEMFPSFQLIFSRFFPFQTITSERFL